MSVTVLNGIALPSFCFLAGFLIWLAKGFDEETDWEGKPGLTDCGLPLLKAVLPRWWAGHQAEQGEQADGGEGGHPADQGGVSWSHRGESLVHLCVGGRQLRNYWAWALPARGWVPTGSQVEESALSGSFRRQKERLHLNVRLGKVSFFRCRC